METTPLTEISPPTEISIEISTLRQTDFSTEILSTEFTLTSRTDTEIHRTIPYKETQMFTTFVNQITPTEENVDRTIMSTNTIQLPTPSILHEQFAFTHVDDALKYPEVHTFFEQK